MQLCELPKVLTKAVATSKMVSKRSARSYVEEDTEREEKEYQAPAGTSRLPADNSALIVHMERSSSSSSSDSRVSSSTSSSTSHADRAVVNLGMELTDLLGREASVSPAHNAGLVTGATPSACQPANFGVVIPGVYRSSYPKVEDYGFIRGLSLKTIVTLVDKKFPEGYRSFISTNGIRHHVFQMKGTKKEEIPIQTMKAILRIVLDRRNHPLLLHCNHGKHRTGCVVAIVRKIAGWDLPSIIEEYKAYAGVKVRECDLAYIAAFDVSSLTNLFANETKTVGFRVPNFFRVAFFTMTVLIIWMVSGSKMTPTSQRR